MHDFEQSLRNLTLAPYIVKAMALIGVKRRGGSNMFRHQLNTLAILLDYKIIDPVLLKAAVIHDLFEDAPGTPGVTQEEIVRLDSDGATERMDTTTYAPGHLRSARRLSRPTGTRLECWHGVRHGARRQSA
jgi:hypothetical protein